MNTRLLLGALLVALLATSAGCAGAFGSGEISDEKLNAPASYGWTATETDVYVNITGSEYETIYTVSNRSRIAVHRFGELGQEQPLDISAVQFRYQNGTVVTPANASGLAVDKRNSRTVISLPDAKGQLAYTARKGGGRSLQIPAVIEGGSYEVVLPPDTRVGSSLLGTASPRGFESRMIDGRVHLTWEQVDAKSVRVRYYLARDMWIFLGIVGIVGLVGLGLIGYAYLQVRRLVRKRERLGLNIDLPEDDSGGGPGP